MLERLRPILAYLVSSDIQVLPFQKSSRNCVCNSIARFAENTCMNILALLRNLLKSQSYKYIAIFLAISMLSTKITVFAIDTTKVVGVIRWLSSSKPDFII